MLRKQKQRLALHSIHRNLMPARSAFGKVELQAVRDLFAYYKGINLDFGYQDRYEEFYTDAFVSYMGTYGYADAVCSGTAALFASIASLQLKPNSHVVVSPVTDPGTVSAIILNQLVPVLADSSPNSYNIGVEEFEASITPKTRVVIVVHLAGKSAPIDKICAIAEKRGMYVIEDCSQAHGAKLNGRKVGTFGDIAVFSTMYRKAHATGGCGGVIFTKSKKLYNLVRAYADRGKPFFKKDFDEKNPAIFLFPALNLNIDEISCAIGIKTLAKLDDNIKKRLNFLCNLKEALEKKSKVCKFAAPSEEDSPFFEPILVDTSRISCSKVEFAKVVQEQGIAINPHYMYVVSEWPWVRPYLLEKYRCENAVKFRDSSFNLLLNENYGKGEVKKIVNAILEVERLYSK